MAIMGCKAPKLSGYAEKSNLSSKAKYDVSTATIRDNGRGFTVDFAKLKKPAQKIALVSFYTEDPGITKKSGTRSTGQTIRTSNTSQEGVEQFSNYFYKTGYTSMDQAFNANGMDILTPTEFLTSDDKKRYYKSFVVKHSDLNKIGGKLSKFLKKMGNAGTTLESKGAADGFIVCNLTTNHALADAKKKSVNANGGVGILDDKLIQSLGYDLCKELDVDAVIVVTNTMVCDNKHRQARHFLSAVSMYMFGPNPLPLAEGKKDNMFYSKGLFYSGYRMAFKKGLCIDPKIKDEGKRAENDVKNAKAYNNMITSIANKMCDEIKQK